MTIVNRRGRHRVVQSFMVALATISLIVFSTWSTVASARMMKAEPAAPTIQQFLAKVDPNCQRFSRCTVAAKTVFAALQINSIDSNLDAPNKYLIRGWLSLNWLPAAYPEWDPSNLAIGCRERSSSCKFSGWQSTFNSVSGDRRIWGSSFELEAEERDTFFNYPFDQHWVKIILQPKGIESDQFSSNIDIETFKVQFSPKFLLDSNSSDYNINFATVGRKDNSNLIYAILPERGDLRFHAKNSSPEQAQTGLELDYLTTSVSFHLVRRTPAALWMIITPLLLIFATTVIGFHWRESGPASRFGASGLLSAVSLYFASRVFRPSVDYLVFSDIWFLIDYIAITINSALLLWLFRFYKHRSELKLEGKAIAPAWKAENMLTFWNVSGLSAILIILFLISQRMLQPPSIPFEFLASNSTNENYGTGVVKVIEKNELLPSFYLLPISSKTNDPDS
jgi:hypothetical protein